MKNKSVWNNGEINLKLKKNNCPLTLLKLLQKQDFPQDIKIDITQKNAENSVVCIGKTATWILEQPPFSSIFSYFGKEVAEHHITKNRIAIILK